MLVVAHGARGRGRARGLQKLACNTWFLGINLVVLGVVYVYVPIYLHWKVELRLVQYAKVTKKYIMANGSRSDLKTRN